MTATRRNIVTNQAARDDYVRGVNLLKQEQAGLTTNDLGIPSRPGVGSQQVSTYDLFVIWHVAAMNEATPPGASRNAAHMGPAFLPWHRWMLILLEAQLQRVLGDENFGLPYWDWADLSGSNPFTNDFLGGEGDGADNRVTTSDFAYVNGKWPLRVPPENASSIDPFLTRKSPFTDESFSNLPTPDEELALVNVTPLDASPWNDGSGTQGFRNRLEGWFGRLIVTIQVR